MKEKIRLNPNTPLKGHRPSSFADAVWPSVPTRLLRHGYYTQDSPDSPSKLRVFDKFGEHVGDFSIGDAAEFAKMLETRD